jgi:hypothetical protein
LKIDRRNDSKILGDELRGTRSSLAARSPAGL